MSLIIKPGEPLVTIDLGDVGTLDLAVKFTPKKPIPDPDPDPQPDPQPGDKTHAVYYMCWSNSGSPLFANLPGQYNEIRLAFAQTSGGHLRLVGSGSQDVATFKAAIAARRKAGDRVLISIGGEKGAVDTGNPKQFVADLLTIVANQTGPVDGIDWDVEASALNKANVLAINKAVIETFPKWRISFAPNGNNVDAYLSVAVETYKTITQNIVYGQQFYDAVVSWNDVVWRVDQAIAAELPANVILLGIANPMSGESAATQAKRWTVEVATDYTKRALAAWKGFAGAYNWEAGRQRNADYARVVGSALGLK